MGGGHRGEQRCVRALQSTGGIHAQTQRKQPDQESQDMGVRLSSALYLLCDLGLLMVLSEPWVFSPEA